MTEHDVGSDDDAVPHASQADPALPDQPAQDRDVDEYLNRLFGRTSPDEPAASPPPADATPGPTPYSYGATDDPPPWEPPPAPPAVTTELPPPATPGRSRTVLVVLGAAALLLVGVGIGAFVAVGGNGTNPNDAVETAVQHLVGAKTADVGMSIGVKANGTSLTMTGNGETNFRTSASNMTITYTVSGQPLTERSIIDGSTMYINLGPLVGEVVPGKSWVSLDLGRAAPGTSGFGPGGIYSDPNSMLSVLRARGTDVSELGTSMVNGSQVQGYRLQLGQEGIDRVIASSHVPAYMRSAMAQLHYSRLDYVIYVGGSNQLKEIRTTATFSAAGEHATVNASMDFSNYGVGVAVTDPPTNQVIPFDQFDKIAKQSQAPTST